MRYYQVSVSSEPKIIGVNNGVYQLEIDESKILQNDNYKKFKEFFNYSNKEFWTSQSEIEFLNPPTIKCKMIKNAKFTDIMGYAPEYTFLKNIYSDKFYEILKAHNLGKYFDFKVEIEGNNEGFFMLFFETIKAFDINYNKSKVITGHKALNNVKYHQINDFDDYKTFLQNNPLADFEAIAIPKEYYGRDVISIQTNPNKFYSDRLIEFLEDNNITGLKVGNSNSTQLEFV